MIPREFGAVSKPKSFHEVRFASFTFKTVGENGAASQAGYANDCIPLRGKRGREAKAWESMKPW